MRRIGLYLRVSTEEQARIQDGSLVSQRQRLLEYVENQNRRENNWGQLIEIYCDEGKSAKDMNRPEFQRLLQDVKLGRVNLVIATELSRLSRSIRDFCEVWDIFKKQNAGFITLRENFDTTTAAGEMMVFNLINFAQYERKQTAERISANWLSRAKRGLWNGGSIPLGYDRNPKNAGELLVNPTESEQVRIIFQTFIATGSLRETARRLTELGIFSKKYTNKHGLEKGGGHFTLSSLYRILTNKAYIGIREVNKSKGLRELTKAVWTSIIDDRLFETVQEKLVANRNKLKPDQWKKYPYPLTEILVCGECGKNLGGKSAHGRNGKHHYYSHPRNIHADGITHLKKCRVENLRADRIEELLLKQLKTLAEDSSRLDHWLEVYGRNNVTELPALEARINSLESDKLASERKVQNLVARIADLPTEISADPFYDQIKALNQKVKDLEVAMSNLEVKVKDLSAKTINRDGLLARVRRAINNLEGTPAELRKPLYSNVIKFAEIHANKVRMGVFAPTESLENKKATGTGGFALNPSLTLATRGGSTSVAIGARKRT